jgi:hypothetical protein
MKRTQKIGLAICTVWPVIYVLALLTVARVVDLKSVVGPSPPPEGLPVWFLLLLALHLITILAGGAVTIFYLWRVFKGGRIPRHMRLPWVLFLVLGSIVAVIPFFWLYVWPDEAVSPHRLV